MVDLPPGHDPGPLRPVLRWVDGRFGPIRRLQRARLAPPHPDLWLYACELARVPPGTAFQAFDANAGGASVSPGEALQRALGEAVERYCALMPPAAQSCFSLPWGESPLANLFPVCAPEEPFVEAHGRLTGQSLITHVEARRLSDDRPAPVPADSVYLAFRRRADEPVAVESVSTGLAFHTDQCAALWSGLCEVAERDAVMIAWWTRRLVPRIRLEGTLPDVLAERLARVRRAGLDPHLFDIGTDFEVPTVLCVMRSNRYPYFTVSAACCADPRVACSKALDEAVYLQVCFEDRREEDAAPAEQFGWPRTLEAHGRLYAHWQGTPAFDFLLAGKREERTLEEFLAGSYWSPPRDASELARLAARLERMGLTPFGVDLTTADARPLGSVMKVVVPQMVPLSCDHRARWLGTPRLLEWAGLREPELTAMNPFPHPFA